MDKYKNWTRCCCMVDMASSNFVAGFDWRWYAQRVCHNLSDSATIPGDSFQFGPWLIEPGCIAAARSKKKRWPWVWHEKHQRNFKHFDIMICVRKEGMDRYRGRFGGLHTKKTTKGRKKFKSRIWLGGCSDQCVSFPPCWRLRWCSYSWPLGAGSERDKTDLFQMKRNIQENHVLSITQVSM